MKGSFPLARVAGIDIKVHFTFPLILLVGALQWGGEHGTAGALFGVLMMICLFACVVLHELGHSVVAQRLGIPVREIILLPIGGVALLSKNPRKPVHELAIAVAGPLVNVLIAALLFAGLGAAGRLSLDPEALLAAREAGPSLDSLLHWLLAANVTLVVFNLVPAFPMDGGRILRAALAMGLGFSRATRIATGIGQLIALGLGIYAISEGQILLALLALFVFLSAGGERAAEEARGLLSTLRLRDAYNKHALTLQAGDRVSRVVDYLLTSYQPDFAVIHGGQLLGVVTRAAVLQALVANPGDGYVTGVMNRNVQRLDAGLSLAEAQEQMAEAGVAVAAVYDDERFLGLVNLDDLREALQIAAFLRAGEARQHALDAA
jgi:Zn-dependent protease